MSRVLYLGPPGAVRLSDRTSVADLMLATGRNTGNLLIGDAIRRHLRPATFETIDSLLQSAGEPLTTRRMACLDRLDTHFIDASFDVLVIGAANFLFEQFDFGGWADFLESIALPCVIIGLGAQAPDYDSQVRVPPGTERMVRIVAERSTTLGVRGHFTAAVLDRMGIKNVRVIGCPSMYWTCQPRLTINRRASRDGLAVWLNGSANVVAHSPDAAASQRVEAKIARLSFEHGYPYILQNETELMEIVRNGAAASDAAAISVLMHRYGLPDTSPETFIDFVRTNMKFFSDTRDWLPAVASSDFVLGTRFHGCLIGLLAGVPSFVFLHDARTREMCELLDIPGKDVRDVGEIDIRALYDSLNLESLDAAYSRLYRNYIDFLDENDLDHCLGAESRSGPPA